ncbi:putative ATP-grasp-modified RiPP [Streptomyces sp. XM4193]|uniref:putative ATP-grasp-modified RiPP n=1 Tax=Streptomyces sp. XM4193 TaxID=2929782 RepID=UPI001FF743BA|nr:putative ATP-grasp-modified RiPP [Streptomyces sp. XM4193]MCK1796880.1 putative ATP-grasp-modified RiPP [Streptomyces sp. XM4193]
MDQTPAPWGTSRMRPYPSVIAAPATGLVLDHATQTARWVDPDGVRIPTLDRHRRSQTSKETSTRTSLDGTTDEGSDQEGDSD